VSKAMTDTFPAEYIERIERSILGAIMLRPQDCLPKCSWLTTAHFHDIRHQDIFGAILALEADGVSINENNIFLRLREQGKPTNPVYLFGLADGQLPFLESHWLNAIRTRKAQRDLSELVQKASVPGADIGPIFESVKAVVAQAESPDGRIFDELCARKFSPAQELKDATTVYSLGGVDICTSGNLTAITAHAKAGKSAFLGAMIAATLLTPTTAGADTLKIISKNPDGLALLHFDTEQSPYDHAQLLKRAMKRAERDQMPAWLQSYCLTGMSARNAWQALQMAVREAAAGFKAIHSILIDGVADMVADVNDAEECNAFVAELHDLAIKNDCPIVGVIHFNPGSEKVRGHLGSQLERKAETNLALKKDGEITVAWSEKQRRAPILKENGPSFRWSSTHGMHRSCAPEVSSAVQAAMNQIDAIYADKPSFTYTDLRSAIAAFDGKSSITAERTITKWQRLGLVRKSIGRLYVKGFNDETKLEPEA
jgi:hypothetical protein